MSLRGLSGGCEPKVIEKTHSAQHSLKLAAGSARTKAHQVKNLLFFALKPLDVFLTGWPSVCSFNIMVGAQRLAERTKVYQVKLGPKKLVFAVVAQ